MAYQQDLMVSQQRMMQAQQHYQQISAGAYRYGGGYGLYGSGGIYGGVSGSGNDAGGTSAGTSGRFRPNKDRHGRRNFFRSKKGTVDPYTSRYSRSRGYAPRDITFGDYTFACFI